MPAQHDEHRSENPAAVFNAAIAASATLAILVHVVLRLSGLESVQDYPLKIGVILGGIPLVAQLLRKLWGREFGSDLLAGMSIVVSIVLKEYLAGTLVVLMLSGGETLEAFAIRSASSVLRALSRRMPTVAHKKVGSQMEDTELANVAVGDMIVVFPHETCPVDGTVVDGNSVMDESFLTGEPYRISKTVGANVISGAVNGDGAIVIRADALAIDSRYAKIMEVMRTSEQKRTRIRRLSDRLGAWFTPLALAMGLLAWVMSSDSRRLLAVLVVATPCPLLIAIPVAIIGAVSLAAKRSIIVRDPVALETADTCRTIIFDKTGTLTYGSPELTENVPGPGFDPTHVLALVSSLEQFSKHPLAPAIIEAGRQSKVVMFPVSTVSEKPGAGLTGYVDGHRIEVTSRRKLSSTAQNAAQSLPPQSGGLECVVLIDDQFAALFRFRDQPRDQGKEFVHHLAPKHRFERIMLVSGDRKSEVDYMARLVGIDDIHYDQSPEQKLAIVHAENLRSRTIFVGDGINDAPALVAASIGIAFGQNSDVTLEAGDVIIMDSSLERVDEFLHISRRMRKIALQSAVGGMSLSVVGMAFAAIGWLPPVAGAITQEIIDLLTVLNALRVALLPKSLVDYEQS